MDQLRSKEIEHIEKLHQIVRESLLAEELIVHNLLHPPVEVLTKGQTISDKVAQFGGSWRFIGLFGLVLLVWISFNAIAMVKLRFDPYPFILMNLILSCIAAMQAPIIMMSQNRKEEKDRVMSENDYMINLKSEMQIHSLHDKMNLLLEEQIVTLFAMQEKQLRILEELGRKVNHLMPHPIAESPHIVVPPLDSALSIPGEI